VIFARSYTSALGGVPMGSRKARDVAIVIPNRIGRGGHPFRMAKLPMTGMKTAADAVFDFTFDIDIIILTIIATTISCRN
jgi:hypothetical protein